MVRQSKGGAIPQYLCYGNLHSRAGEFVDDPEDILQRPANDVIVRRSQQALRHVVDEHDAPFGIGGNDRIANASQGCLQTLAMLPLGMLCLVGLSYSIPL